MGQRPIFNFIDYGHVAYQIKGNDALSSMAVHIIPADTHDGLGQNSNFSEHGHVAYQIKWNHECSNMVSNILPAKFYFF